MRILVLGALGSIGKFLTRELSSRGHEIYLSDIANHHATNYLKCNIASFRELERVFSRVEAQFVFNLAAEFGRANGEDHYEALWKSNVIGLKHVLTLQERYRFKLVHMSSSEVYGDYDGVMSEAVTDSVPIKQSNDYAVSKWVNELQIMNAQARCGVDVVRIRPFNVYGPGEHYSPYRSFISRFIYHALHDLPYVVYRDHARTCTFVTDIARTLANVVDNFRSGEVYNIAGSECRDIKTYSDMILACLGKNDSRVTYRGSQEFTARSKRADCSKAIRELDHAPAVRLADGIPATVEWYRTEHAGSRDAARM